MSLDPTHSEADPTPRSPEDVNFEDANEAADSNSILSTLLTPGPPASELIQQPVSRRNSNSSTGPSTRAPAPGSNSQRSNPVASSMPSSTNSASRDRVDPVTCAKDNGPGVSLNASYSPPASHSAVSKGTPKVPSSVPLPSVSTSPSRPPASAISPSESSMAASSQASMPSQQVASTPFMAPNPLMMMMMGMSNPFFQPMMTPQLSSGTSIGGQMNDPMAMMNLNNMNLMKMWGELSGMKPTSAASASGPAASTSTSTPEAHAVEAPPSDTNSNSMHLFHENLLVWRKDNLIRWESLEFAVASLCNG